MAKKSLSVVEIPSGEILEPAHDMRLGFDPDRLLELVESIRELGLLNPITVKKVDAGFEVVAGNRRFAAIKKLKWKTVPCIVFPKDGLDAEVAKMHENSVREAVNITEEANFLLDLANAYKLNGKQLAAKIGRTESYVSDRLKLLKGPPQVADAVAKGELSFSAARELLKIRDENVQREYIAHAIRSGVNDATAKQWRVDANAAADAGQPAPAEPGAVVKDSVQEVRVQCALTGKTYRIDRTMVVRVHIESWNELLAEIAKPE